MKVLYDSHIFCTQKFGGISKYFMEITNNANFEYEIPFIEKFVKNIELQNRYSLKPSILLKLYKIHGLLYKTGVISTLNQIQINKVCKKYKPMVYHATSKMYSVPQGIKKVVTIHDLIFENIKISNIDSTLKRSIELLRDEKEKQIFNSDKIIAISHNTKKDILKLYPSVPESKINVIYHGGITCIDIEEIKLPQKYILFVGDRGLYKNFRILVDACEILFKKHKDLNLVCVGGGSFDQNEIQFIQERSLTKNIFLYLNMTNKQLNYIYQNALTFVYPSIYEGFGIPILEAFGNNCPVILSNCSCFPEIAQSAGLYFNPADSIELSEKIYSIITDKELRENKLKLGYLRNKDFSWKKSSQEHQRAYNSLI